MDEKIFKDLLNSTKEAKKILAKKYLLTAPST